MRNCKQNSGEQSRASWPFYNSICCVTGESVEEKETTESADLGVDLDSYVSSMRDLKTETVDMEERVKVLVADAESPSDFWIQLASKKAQLDELLNHMFDVYTATTDGKLNIDNTDENDMIVAALSEDESWYRARVVSTDEQGVAVQFLDYGNKEVVPQTSLRKLVTAFSELPVQGIRCCLAGVVPKQGGDWSPDAKQAFTEIILEKYV